MVNDIEKVLNTLFYGFIGLCVTLFITYFIILYRGGKLYSTQRNDLIIVTTDFKLEPEKTIIINNIDTTYVYRIDPIYITEEK